MPGSTPDPPQLQAASELIKRLATEHHDDISKTIAAVQRSEQQTELGIAPRLIYMVGLVASLCPMKTSSSNNQAQALFAEFQKLYHDTQYRHALKKQPPKPTAEIPAPPKVNVYQWSRSMHPSPATLTNIQQQMAETVISLEQEANQAAQELLQQAQMEESKNKPMQQPVKKKAPRLQQPEQESSPVRSTTSPPKEPPQTLQQVLASIHIDQKVDESDNQGWVPVARRTSRSLLDTSHHKVINVEDEMNSSSSYSDTVSNSIISSQTGGSWSYNNNGNTRRIPSPPPPTRSKYATTLASAIPEAASSASCSRKSRQQAQLDKRNPSGEVGQGSVASSSQGTDTSSVTNSKNKSTVHPLRDHRRKQQRRQRDLIEATRSLDTSNLRAMTSMTSQDNNSNYLGTMMSYDQGVRAMPSYDQPIRTAFTAPLQRAPSTATMSSIPEVVPRVPSSTMNRNTAPPQPSTTSTSLIQEHGTVETVLTMDSVPKYEPPTADNKNYNSHKRVGCAAQPIVIPEQDEDETETAPTLSSQADVSQQQHQDATLISSLQDQLAALQAQLDHERQDHASRLRQEQALAEERVQALQLRLYISETRLQLYEESLSQHIQTVANNVGSRNTSPPKQQHQQKSATPVETSPLARVLSSQQSTSIEIVNE